MTGGAVGLEYDDQNHHLSPRIRVFATMFGYLSPKWTLGNQKFELSAVEKYRIYWLPIKQLFRNN